MITAIHKQKLLGVQLKIANKLSVVNIFWNIKYAKMCFLFSTDSEMVCCEVTVKKAFFLSIMFSFFS